MSKLINKVSISVVSIATVLSLSGAGILLPVAVHGATAEELQAQIASLLVMIQTLQSQLSATSGTSAVSSTVPASLLTSNDLTVGSKGAAVKDLQRFLNGAGYAVATSGVGSVGNESEYFGNATKAALAKFQAAQSLSPAAGYFGAKTRAKLSAMSSAGTGTGTVVTTLPSGCTSTAGFSSTTGQSCSGGTTTTVPTGTVVVVPPEQD